MHKLISWFEIPAVDFNRAIAFYENVLAVKMNVGEMLGQKLAVFPYDRASATGGCIAIGGNLTPSRDGVAVYLNAGDSLDAALERVPAAGGQVVLGRTELPNIGAYAHVIDTEGNRVGLHALK